MKILTALLILIPPYSFTDIKVFTAAEVRDLGRLTHTIA